jgi:hypothetical protein
MEIDVFSRIAMHIYIGMSLWLLFTGFDFESITWYGKYKGDSAEIFKKYLLKERPINFLNNLFWGWIIFDILIKFFK